MCQCYVNGKCKAVLWLAIITFFINDVSATPQSLPPSRDRMRKNNLRENVDVDQSTGRQAKQNFPFVNNPGQQILERIKANLEKNSNLGFGFQGNFNTNLGNLGRPFPNNFGNVAGQAIQNTYGILNKTFENLNQLSMGNFGNPLFTTSRPPHHTNLGPNINNGGFTQVPNYSSISTANGMERQATTPSFKGEDNHISHYVDGKFPVILLRPEDVRK